MGRTHPFLASALLVVLACGGEGPGPTAPSVEEGTMNVTSVFEEGEPIPVTYTCDGDGLSPPLRIDGLPAATRALALVVEDPDAPSGTFDHWVEFDIPPTAEIPEGADDLGVEGRNSSGRTGYTGPCPPSGVHRYYFRIFALDGRLGLSGGATKEEVLDAMEGHLLGEGTLMGTYRR